ARPGWRRPRSRRVPGCGPRRTRPGPLQSEPPLMVGAIKRTTRAVGVGSTAVGGFSGAHLMLLLGAAVLGRDNDSARGSDDLTLAIVIPAHDEEHQIAATMRSLM